jgi:acid phosphatase type 7
LPRFTTFFRMMPGLRQYPSLRCREVRRDPWWSRLGIGSRTAQLARTGGDVRIIHLVVELIAQIHKIRYDPPGAEYTSNNQYPDDTLATYNTYYGPTWGAYKAKTTPVPDNHEYHTAGASGYFSYFNNIPPYYSYNLGSWHLIALNSEIPRGEGSAQNNWLEADLAANTQPCILAYWHKPLFSSGSGHGGNSSQQPFWDDLYATGADIVLAGHDHTYERFAVQNPTGVADPSGIRQFVVGTGGKQHYGFGTIQPNSEVRNSDTFGVLKLTLRSSSYEWTFLPEAGKTFSDGGTNACH